MYAKAIMTHHSAMQLQVQNNRVALQKRYYGNHIFPHTAWKYCFFCLFFLALSQRWHLYMRMTMLRSLRKPVRNLLYAWCDKRKPFSIKSIWCSVKLQRLIQNDGKIPNPFPLVRWDLWVRKGQGWKGHYVHGVTCSGGPLKAAKIHIWVKLWCHVDGRDRKLWVNVFRHTR